MKYILTLLVVSILSASDQSLDKGDVVPDIVMKDLNGETLKLSSLKGKMVLLDFWASWCKPCRKENPMIVRMYRKYKDEEFENGNGFTVFSVSLDFKPNPWEEAIKKDSLIWENHVSDLKGWKNEAAIQYGIQAIPQSYLLDGDGRIVAINPRGEKLEKELKKNKKSGSSSFWSLFGW